MLPRNAIPPITAQLASALTLAAVASTPAAADHIECMSSYRGCPHPEPFYTTAIACRPDGAVVTLTMGGCWPWGYTPHSPRVSVADDRIDFVVTGPDGGPTILAGWCQQVTTPPLPDGAYRVFTTILPGEPIEREPLVITCGCYADCDQSGDRDFFDFLCFQSLFAAGDPEADCDGSGDLDFFDFLCFQNAFAAGCS